MLRYVVLTLGIVLLVIPGALAGRDFYKILEVPRGADEGTIKRAYRRLSLENHPDKGGDADKFAEISSAYEVLSDSDKRKTYDRYGEEGLKQREQGGGGGSGCDVFSQFFGGFGGFGGGQREPEAPRAPDLVIPVQVTLEDLYKGSSFPILRDRHVIKSAPGTRNCNCKNRMVTKQVGPGMFQQFAQQECDSCPNVKLVREATTLNVDVEPGMDDGMQIVFHGESDAMIDHDPGNLILRIETEDHDRFRREGDDLHVGVRIALVDALTGLRVVLPHLDGHEVIVERSGVTFPQEVVTIPGEGMPLTDSVSRHGDLHVHFTVEFPRELSAADKSAVRKLFTSVPSEICSRSAARCSSF